MRSVLILFFLYLLMFWTAPTYFRPGMDSMTYGALAKHILETGDWARLHYSAQAYSDFFQHPPLGIWIMAFSMKFLGTDDWVLKVIPSLFAALSCGGIYCWGTKIRGPWFGFMATFVLLTSTRFAKYSQDLMLDPFLATFSVFGMITLLLGIEKKKNSFSLIGGLLIGAAFLSKGLFAFAPLFAGILVLAARRQYRSIGLWVLGAATPLILWYIFGGANEYLHRYYTEHVAGRVGAHSLREHFAPIENLLILYWPWLPFFIFGAYRVVKAHGLRTLHTWEGAALLTSLGFLGGFCLVGSFLEQYHASFYPFAALITAYPLTEGRIGAVLARSREKIYVGLAVIVMIAGIAAIINPAGFTTTEYKNPIRVIIKRAAHECVLRIDHRILISQSVAEIWYALSMGTWNTPWDVVSGPATLTPEAARADLLLAGSADRPGREWEDTRITESGLKIYMRARSGVCVR